MINNNYRATRDAAVVGAITLSEAKRNLALADSMTAFDAFLDGLILAATEFVEDQTNLIIKSQAISLSKDEFPDGPMYVPLGPVISIESITYLDGDDAPQVVDPLDYRSADRLPGRIDPSDSWPAARSSVEIKYTAGHAAGLEPAAAVQAVTMLVAHWFMNRSETQATQVNDVPLTVTSLISSLQTGQDFIGF